MSSIKSIRTKIKSVENTGKITRAMEMVAASKMRRAQDSLNLAATYSKGLLSTLVRFLNVYRDQLGEQPFLGSLSPRKERVCLIVISSDKGLCGGLNSNLFRHVVMSLLDYARSDISVDVLTFGRKATLFFSSLELSRVRVRSSIEELGDSPNPYLLTRILNDLLPSYPEGYQELRIFHNEFVNRMKQSPKSSILLPFVPEDYVSDLESSDVAADLIVEPSPSVFFETLFQRYLLSALYTAVVENFACEQASRIVAMKAATDNVKSMLQELRLDYNRSRQASITKEIAEIVSGGSVV